LRRLRPAGDYVNDEVFSDMTGDAREAAATTVAELIRVLQSHPGPATPKIIDECEALARAIHAFHMEGIRFRIFNVDRLIAKQDSSVPEAAPALLEEARRHLEAAGFHTRSHQAPPT
jgi:hypothetical protein